MKKMDWMPEFYRPDKQTMITVLRNGQKIEWFHVFNAGSSVCEETIDFAQGDSAAQWLRGVEYHPPAYLAAKALLRDFGVKKTRARAKRVVKKWIG